MHEITQRFLNETTIHETPDGTIEKIMEFLVEPQNVQAMILMTELGQPALSGVVKKLEDRFAYSDFPLHQDAPNHDNNKRNIGKMVQFVMGEFGYSSIKETGIGEFSGANHFKNASVYTKTNSNPNYAITICIH